MFVRLCFSLASLIMGIAAASGQPYPSRPIMIVVPFAAGGLADSSARQLAQALKNQLGRAVIVENRPGAGGTIGARSVQGANPDGYTLLYGSVGPMVGSLYLIKDLPYHPLKDFIPIYGLTETPMVLVTQSTKPYKSLKELVAYAKAYPGKVTYGSVGLGSTLHLISMMLEQSGEIQMLHVPYKGSAPALNDPKTSARIFSGIPLGRAGTPEEIAGPILFLCSEYAGFITGEVFNVNGGAVLVG